ncbi:exo-alpha-sialidase [Roseovarius aestuarii]|nr:exo-alpha-sialidase [Roseovarius aestuarii]
MLGSVHLAILGLAVLSLGLSGWALRRDAPLDWRLAPPAPVDMAAPRAFETILDYTAASGQAHSPAVILRPGGVRIAWFEGSQEARADVDIFAVDILRESSPNAPARLITRGRLGKVFTPRQAVITLGNTIQNDTAEDAAYATVVSVGGWAMASIADVRLGVSGPISARKLNLSPFLNRSFLVKSPMLGYADGSQALPAYFEMGQTYGALIRLDAAGRVRDMRRMPGRFKAIQPMIVPMDDQRAVAFLRNFQTGSDRLLISRTTDGGQSWSEVQETNIPNLSAPVAALALGEGRILMAVNDDAADGGILRLTISEDEGRSWRRLRTLEDAGGQARYPMMRALPDGQIVLAYSHGGKGGIRAHRFTAEWALSE